MITRSGEKSIAPPPCTVKGVIRESLPSRCPICPCRSLRHAFRKAGKARALRGECAVRADRRHRRDASPARHLRRAKEESPEGARDPRANRRSTPTTLESQHASTEKVSLLRL